MQSLYDFITKVAPTASTVLIRGESGTGKELVAREIHRNSPRADRPFIAVNCATLTESLLESELFGHERGAFTGAIAQKRGKIEEAHQGTLFLDEVGELAFVLQAKLLRFLQERQFERIGGLRPIHVDVRLIAATNRDLESAVNKREFREDMYYRLNVLSATTTPLRHRREDIRSLANHFVQICANRCNRRVSGLTPEAAALLAGYDWPGNVRELENAIERGVVLGTGDLIGPEDLPEALAGSRHDSEPLAPYHESVLEHKKRLIIRAMEKAEGKYSEAAEALGLHPNYLHRLIRNLDLRTIVRACC